MGKQINEQINQQTTIITLHPFAILKSTYEERLYFYEISKEKTQKTVIYRLNKRSYKPFNQIKACIIQTQNKDEIAKAFFDELDNQSFSIASITRDAHSILLEYALKKDLKKQDIAHGLQKYYDYYLKEKDNVTIDIEKKHFISRNEFIINY